MVYSPNFVVHLVLKVEGSKSTLKETLSLLPWVPLKVPQSKISRGALGLSGLRLLPRAQPPGAPPSAEQEGGQIQGAAMLWLLKGT